MDTPQTAIEVANAASTVSTAVGTTGGLGMLGLVTWVWKQFAKTSDLDAISQRVSKIEEQWHQLPDKFVTHDKLFTLEAKIDDVGKHLSDLNNRINDLTNTLLTILKK